MSAALTRRERLDKKILLQERPYRWLPLEPLRRN